MNLNELQPAEGSKFAPKRVGREVAVALDRALKVVKCHYTEDFLSVDLRIYLQSSMLLLTLRSLISLRTEQKLQQKH